MKQQSLTTPDPHRLFLQSFLQISLKRGDKKIQIFNIYYIGENIKKSYRNNKLK